MDEIGDIAKNKIGGLPVWGWAAALSGIVLIFAWWRNRSGSAGTAAPAIFDGTTTASGLANVGVPSSGQNSMAGPSPETLDDWMNQAVAAGGSNTDVLGALNSFLSGQPLSAAQKSTVDSILGKVGLPPGYSSLPASQPIPATDNSVYDQINQQISNAIDSFSQSNSQYQDSLQQSITEQMTALSNQVNTLAIPAPKPAAPKPTQQQAIANAQSIAADLGRSVKTAYGYVTPTGLVTSTDTTAAKKANAKAISIQKNAPVNTSFGWITPTGVVYKTQAEAVKAMGKK